jgi:hypothetical protein
MQISRLIARVMKKRCASLIERWENARNLCIFAVTGTTLSWPVGLNSRREAERRCEKIQKAELFLTMERARIVFRVIAHGQSNKRFWRRLSGHEGFAHAPHHLSDSHRNLHLLTRFYCALKLPQLPSNKAEGSLRMHTTSWIIEKV